MNTGENDGGDDEFLFNIDDENFKFDEDDDDINGFGFGGDGDGDDDDDFMFHFTDENNNDDNNTTNDNTNNTNTDTNNNNTDNNENNNLTNDETEQNFSQPQLPKKPRLVLPTNSKDKRTVNTLIEDIQSFTPESIPKTQMQDPKQSIQQEQEQEQEQQRENDGNDSDSLFDDIKMDEIEQNSKQNEETATNLQTAEETLVTQRIPLSEQMIPGPAGGLNVKKDEKSDLGESIEDVMRPGFPYNTERDGSKKAFLSQAWVRMLHDNRMYPFGDEKASTNVRYVNKYGFLEKVPRLFVVINEVVPLDTINVKLKLMDPSGKISGMAPKKALDQFPDMKNGSVLSLRKVSVFNSSRTSHHLNIVPENIHKIYTNDRREGEEEEHEYVKAVFMNKIENDISAYLKDLCANIYDIKTVKKSNSSNQLQDPSKGTRSSPNGVTANQPFGVRKVTVQSPARKPYTGTPVQMTPKRTLSGSNKVAVQQVTQQQQQQATGTVITAVTTTVTPLHKKASPVIVVGSSQSVGMARSPSRVTPKAQQQQQQKSVSPPSSQPHYQGLTTPLAQKKTQQRVIVASQKTPAVVVSQKSVVVVNKTPPANVGKTAATSSQRPVIVIGKQQKAQQPVVIVQNTQKKQRQTSPQSQQMSQKPQISPPSQYAPQKHPIVIVGKRTNSIIINKKIQNESNNNNNNNNKEIIDLVNKNDMNDDDYDDFSNFDFGDDDAGIISKFIQ